MEKLQIPVMAGMGGAAILAAILSFGGGSAKGPAPAAKPEAVKSLSVDDADKGAAPNQDGPWRAVCEEYAPNGAFEADPTQTHRGYKVERAPGAPDGTTEVTIGPDSQRHINKIAVHKQLIGNLTDCIPKDQISGIHLIIATVPDPDKTEMRMVFDRDIDALEKAAAIRGFRYTGYWFPWSPRQSGSPPRKEEEVEAALLRAEQPGILLFHNDEEQRLFVFIVGETPTSGIDRMQMVRALRYRQDLINAMSTLAAYEAHNVPLPKTSTAGAALGGPLMISGPHYSGSLSSLKEVLWEGKLLRETKLLSSQVRILSPETSSTHLIEQFTNVDCTAPACEFVSLSLRADEQDQVASNYLQRLGYRQDQIAELIEDESGFSAAQSDPSNNRATQAAIPLVLKFPRELSAVRSLSDQKSEQLAESGAKLLSFTKNTGDIKLAGQGSVEYDRPPTYAAEAEVSEISNALEDDIRVLKDKQIECVVISATNPLDGAFLLEYMHDRLPNVRLAVEDADSLEISHPHFVDLTGTVVVSTLPIIPELGIVGHQPPVHLSFSSVSEQNEFLSVAMLLDDDKNAATSGKLHEDGWRVSLVGEENFELVPPADLVRLEDQGKTPISESSGEAIPLFGKDDSSPALEKNIELKWEQPYDTREFFYFSVAIFALTLVHLIRILNSERPAPWRSVLKRLGFNCDRPLKFAYVEREGEQGFGRAFHLLALNNQIFLLNCLVLSVNPYPFNKLRLGWYLIALGAWMMVAMLGTATVLLLFELIGAARKKPKVSTLEAMYAICMLLYVISTSWFLWHWRSETIAEWRRLLDLSNGLSPVWPITTILISWGLWAALQLQRVKWICHRKMDLAIPRPLENFPLVNHLCDDMDKIHETIDAPTINWKSVLLMLIFLGVFLTSQQHSFSGIEPDSHSEYGFGMVGQLILSFIAAPSFRWWFGTWGVAMVLVTVIQSAYQIYQMWKALARLLGRLDITRMKRAFEQIGEDDSIHIKLWDLGKSQLRFDEMTLIVESLRKMNQVEKANDAQEALEVYQEVDLQREQPSSEDRDKLNRALNARVEKAMKELSSGLGRPSGRFSMTAFLQRRASKQCSEKTLNPSEELDRYLALRLTTLIRYVLLQMRNLMWFVIYGFFLAVVSVAFYPFQGGRNLSNMLAAAFLIVLLIMVGLVTDILRSPMLKKLEDRESNIATVLQASFHLLSVGGLPVLALLAWQFPWIGQIAFSWLRPLLSSFR